jgi:P22 coat protein - gene protein 5
VANQFVFSNWVAMECLRLLVNQLEVAQHFDTKWMRQFDQQFAVGSSVQVKLPQKWTVRSGLGYQPQPINRITTTVNCNLIKGIDFEWDSIEKALEMERSEREISDQYIAPAAAQLAQQIDSDAAGFAYKNANNIVGVLGQDPTTSTTFMQGLQTLTELSCPPGGEKGAILTPSVATAIVPNIQTYFNPASEISRAFKQGSLGMFNGFEWHQSMSIKRHTAGTAGTGGTLIIAANVNSNSNVITITGTNGETFLAGDVIAIDAANYVNPMTREAPNPKLKQFVVMQDVTLTGGADAVIVSPTIYGPGSQYQNVDALPLANANVTLFPGTTSPQGKSGAQNLLIHPDAFALVSVKLESPEAVEVISQNRDKKTGIAIRFVRAFDATQSRMINRWDMVYGFGAMYPDNCCVRMLGA